jgi:hypothetical protein
MAHLKYRRDLHTIIDLGLPATEVGVAEGNFSRDMLSWGLSKLYMVDNWATIPGAYGDGASDQAWHDQNFTNALKLVKPFGGKYHILRGLSVDMAAHIPDAHLGLVYLDACHTYECVLADLEAWFPKLVTGGIMAGHDFLMSHYGVQQAVLDFTKGKYKVHLIPEDEKKDAGFWFKK